MTYEQIIKHQKFISEKSAALKSKPYQFENTLRNLRLMRLNNRVSELLIELNKISVQEIFNDGCQLKEKGGAKMIEAILANNLQHVGRKSYCINKNEKNLVIFRLIDLDKTRWNSLAERTNARMFMEMTGKAPTNPSEVKEWVNGLIQGTKKAHPHCNEEKALNKFRITSIIAK